MVSIEKKKYKQLRAENGEKLFTVAASYSVLSIILSVIGIRIKQNFKGFPLKVPQMQKTENPCRSSELQK